MCQSTSQVQDLAFARGRLQWVLICTVLLAVLALVPLVFHADSLPTVPQCPALVDVLSLLVPGLTPRMAQVALTYPLAAFTLSFLVWSMRRGLRHIERAQSELALQQALGNGGYAILRRAKLAAFVGQLWWLAVLLLVIGLTVVVLDISSDAEAEKEMVAKSYAREGTQSCNTTRGPCRLAEGEQVRIAIRSDRINKTGIWLDSDGLYSVGCIAHTNWADDGLSTDHKGYQFRKNLLGVRMYWWAEWLRPLPNVRWFQIVGRVNSRSPAFRVQRENGCNPCAWTPPHDGELVLMVNDVVLSDNTGIMTLDLSRVDSTNKNLCNPEYGRRTERLRRWG